MHFLEKEPFDNNSALVQVMDRRRSDYKPFVTMQMSWRHVASRGIGRRKPSRIRIKSILSIVDTSFIISYLGLILILHPNLTFMVTCYVAQSDSSFCVTFLYNCLQTFHRATSHFKSFSTYMYIYTPKSVYICIFIALRHWSQHSNLMRNLYINRWPHTPV